MKLTKQSKKVKQFTFLEFGKSHLNTARFTRAEMLNFSAQNYMTNSAFLGLSCIELYRNLHCLYYPNYAEMCAQISSLNASVNPAYDCNWFNL